jgi:hypothetical protein|nr:MAG TPA: hypothetical protein [Caudoviricetes sp.]
MTREEMQAVLTEYAGADAETQGQLAARLLDENDAIITESNNREAARVAAVANENALRKQYVERFLGAVPGQPDPPKSPENNPRERVTFDSLFK